MTVTAFAVVCAVCAATSAAVAYALAFRLRVEKRKFQFLTQALRETGIVWSAIRRDDKLVIRVHWTQELQDRLALAVATQVAMEEE